MTLHTRSGGNWHIVDPFYVRQGGVWVPVQEGYVRQGGNWVPFYSAEEGVVAPSSYEMQSLEAIFNATEDGLWQSDKNKRLIVNSYRGPLIVDVGWGGTLTIDVRSNGVINGLAGAAGTGGVGGAGGHALTITVGGDITLINEGIIRGGGGGGGRGGTGGGGEYISYSPDTTGGYTSGSGGTGWKTIYTSTLDSNDPPTYSWTFSSGVIRWGSTTLYSTASQSGWAAKNSSSTHSAGGYVYRRMAQAQSAGSPPGGSGIVGYRIRREQTINTSGGAGGSGGAGQGVSGDAGSGSSGSSGGTNAGTGGTGGAGGAWGTSGSTGNTGANGNRTNGASGSAGGAAGNAIMGYNRVIYSGSGDLVGGTANN